MIAPTKTVRGTTNRSGPDSGSDPILDAMLAEALRQDVPNQPANRHRLAREFVPERGWRVQPRDRRKWVRPLLVVTGALLAMLLLGQMLEHLRPTAYQPAVLPTATATPTQEPTATPQPTPLLQPMCSQSATGAIATVASGRSANGQDARRSTRSCHLSGRASVD